MSKADSALKRGLALLRDGDARGALGPLAEALEADPGHAKGWLAAGRAFAAVGDLAGAEGAFRRATALAPRLVEAWLQLGKVLTTRGVRAEPALCWATALRLDPRNVEARVRLGASHLGAGRLEAAEEHLRGAFHDAPGDPGVVAAWAGMLSLRSDLHGAWRILEGARGRDPRVEGRDHPG